MIAVEAETVHIIVGWNDDYEHAFSYAAGPGDAEDSPGLYEADVPAALWQEAEAKYKEWQALHAKIVELADFDVETARLKSCCAVWRGHENEGHQWLEVCVPASGDENTWPAGGRPVDVAHCDTQDDVDKFLVALPEHFQLLVSSHLVSIDRSILIVEPRGYGGHTSSCYDCGWQRNEHADQGTPE